MTSILDVLDDPLIPAPADEDAPVGSGPVAPADPTFDGVVRPGAAAVASALSCLGVAWMLTAVFRGTFAAPAVAALGVAIGAGTVYASHRFARGGLSQLLGVGIAVVAGAVLATTGEGAERDLLGAVADAVRGGGLLQPPIPFDAGWRFLCVVLFTCLSACACTAAVSMARPKLAVAVPFPIVIGGTLIQPEGREIVSSTGATVLMVAGLAVAYGAELSSRGALGGGFEARRLLRGAGLVVFAVVGLVLLSQTSFLFPETSKDQVIPPQKPPTPPPQPDRPLFTVRSDRGGPWRLGVLDVYEDNGFLLPSIDPGRMKKVPVTGSLEPTSRETYTATFSIIDVQGQTLPAPPRPSQITGIRRSMQLDPRTQVVRLIETSVPEGQEYTVTAPVPPGAKELIAAGAPAPATAKEFTSLPAPPAKVAELIATAPTTSLFERLQFVRQALYENVVAAGAGRPVDVPPARVDDMLGGGQASPFEINAAEVMLSRWAGIPARMGFGYYGGEKVGDVTSFRPKHGAAWLEAYFEGYGWVPIIGTPPRAKSSLSNEPRKDDKTVVPTDDLAVTVFVPVEMRTFQLVYEIVRYYVAVYGPIVLGALVLVFLYPAALKAMRRSRRRRWAAETGPLARIVAAYAELRDTVHDLNGGHPRATPIELLDDVEPDEEHAELAWVVTRALWGDLTRDLRIEDVEAAEEMARSVRSRILREQTAVNRILAATSRASLRDPWTAEIPNAWRRRTRRRPAEAAATGPRARGRRLRSLIPQGAGAAPVLLAVLLLLPGCTRHADGASTPSAHPDPLMPDRVGVHALVHHPGLEAEYAKPGARGLVADGRVFLVQDDDTVQGSVQVARFKERVDAQERTVQDGVLNGLGGAAGFRTIRIGTARVRVLDTPEQRLYAWFPPERNAMELFIMRQSFPDAEEVVRAIVMYQRGLTLDPPVQS